MFSSFSANSRTTPYVQIHYRYIFSWNFSKRINFYSIYRLLVFSNFLFLLDVIFSYVFSWSFLYFFHQVQSNTLQVKTNWIFYLFMYQVYDLKASLNLFISLNSRLELLLHIFSFLQLSRLLFHGWASFLFCLEFLKYSYLLF